MVKTLFKFCKQWYFYQRLYVNRAIAEYDNKLWQNEDFLHYRTASLNKPLKMHPKFYFSKIMFFISTKITVLNTLAEETGFVLDLM